MLGLQLDKFWGLWALKLRRKAFLALWVFAKTLQPSWLGIENLEMFINIYKNQPNDARVEEQTFMKQFMDMEEALMEENEDVFEQIGLFKLEENNKRFQVKFVIYCILSISSFVLDLVQFQIMRLNCVVDVCWRLWSIEAMEIGAF